MSSTRHGKVVEDYINGELLKRLGTIQVFGIDRPAGSATVTEGQSDSTALCVLVSSKGRSPCSFKIELPQHGEIPGKELEARISEHLDACLGGK